MSRGTCRICGCTDKRSCVHPDFGPCFWLDDTHELCSHCVELKDDPSVIRPADIAKIIKEGNKKNKKSL